MDLLSVLQTLLSALFALFSVLWGIMQVAFNLPLIGWIVQAICYVGVAYVLYRYSPAFVRRAARDKALPIMRRSSRPVRWLIVRAIAEPEWLIQGGLPAPRIVTREVVVAPPLWRTRMRWAVTGFALTLILQQHAWYWPHIRQMLGY